MLVVSILGEMWCNVLWHSWEEGFIWHKCSESICNNEWKSLVCNILMRVKMMLVGAILGATKRARSSDPKIAPMIRHEIILQIGRWPNTGPNKYKDSITIKDNLFTASTTIFFELYISFCWGSAGFWKWHDPFHIVPHEKILWSTFLNVCVKNNDRKWQPAPNWWQDVSTSQKKYRP